MLAPALIAVGVIVAILNYNEFLFATFLTQSEDVQTVPVLLAGMLSERIQDFGRIAASSLVAVFPVFTIAVLLQRYLVDGLTTGAVK
jgi:multiple sugar transport system permease protein